MPNYLKMPKKSQVLALLELGWSYRRIEAETGVRRETVSGYDAARQANAAKTFPGSDPSPPADSADVRVDDGFKCGQNVRRLRVKPGQNVPRLDAAPAVRRGALSHGDHREARRRPEPAADLAGPGRGVRVRRELRIGETVRADDRADAPSRRRLSLCARAPKAQVDFFRGAPTLDAATGRVATALGVSDDAGPFAARLRGSGLGSEARDVSPAARARLPRSRRRAARSSATTISKRPSCARASSIPIATTSISRSPRTGASRRCRRSRATRRKTGSRSAVAATSKTTR